MLRLLSSLGGLLVSAYLLVNNWANGAIMICPDNGCDIVNQSAYSEIAGIPVALFGFIGYIVILNLCLMPSKYSFKPLLLWGTTAIGFLFSVYLVGTSIFVIQSVCLWCMISFAAITLLFISATLEVWRRRADLGISQRISS